MSERRRRKEERRRRREKKKERGRDVRKDANEDQYVVN